MRSLGVIFLADVVGYSKMMAQDEPGRVHLEPSFSSIQQRQLKISLQDYAYHSLPNIGCLSQNHNRFGIEEHIFMSLFLWSQINC